MEKRASRLGIKYKSSPHMKPVRLIAFHRANDPCAYGVYRTRYSRNSTVVPASIWFLLNSERKTDSSTSASAFRRSYDSYR